MTLETVPLVLGAVVGLVGLGLVADGWLPDSAPRVAERRRRARAERDCTGEILIGLGLLALAASLAGGDVWRWGTVAVLSGVALLAAGGFRNRHYLIERLLNRGKSRRGRRRERRVELAAERPVPLVVASEVDRRGHDRREDFGYERRPRTAGPLVAAHAAPGASFADRPVLRRASAD
ncbi:hypothetical protein [Roseisolibacter agri]|uniref:Uncharacterized protein n=1 Tax=Roseisolibacter agri TaxID=2014610 RepID=A0AA37VG44_9BACT|nr:hypothetical protein [Roseisolibacter agri]GLC27914.1 hypothetical protein rosag_44270 [Roseisolibacter agri]